MKWNVSSMKCTIYEMYFYEIPTLITGIHAVLKLDANQKSSSPFFELIYFSLNHWMFPKISLAYNFDYFWGFHNVDLKRKFLYLLILLILLLLYPPVCRCPTCEAADLLYFPSWQPNIWTCHYSWVQWSSYSGGR